jgi:hypothetical protein
MRNIIRNILTEKDYLVYDREAFIEKFTDRHNSFYAYRKGHKEYCVISFVDYTIDTFKTEIEDEMSFKDYLLHVATVDSKQISEQFYDKSTDKNIHNIIFVKVNNIDDKDITKIIYEVESDPYQSSRAVILYTQLQENIINELYLNNDNILSNIKSIIFSQNEFNDFINDKNKNDDIVLKYDILSKLLIKLPIWELHEDNYPTRLKRLEIKHDFNNYNVEFNNGLYGKEDIIIANNEFNDIFELLTGKSDIMEDYLENYFVKFTFQNEDKSYVEETYEKGKSKNQFAHNINTFINEHELKINLKNEIQIYFYICTGIVLGEGLILEDFKNGKLVAKPKFTRHFNQYITDDKKEILKIIYNIVISIFSLNDNRNIIVIDFKGINNDMTIAKLIKLLRMINKSMIFINIGNTDILRYIRYKLSGYNKNSSVI